MVTTDEYKRAERELTIEEWRRGWRIHAAVYAGVISGLTVLNVLLVVFTDMGFYWFPFPLAGWGVGLTMHYVFGVRRAEREVGARQAKVEKRAERVHTAA